MLRLFLLGDFRAFDGDVTLETLRSPRLQSLLAYLLLNRHTGRYAEGVLARGRRITNCSMGSSSDGVERDPLGQT
jgi:hypothetical protein